jgi:signal transduction histidine kinase
LLDLSRIEAGRLDIRRGPVDLGALASAAVAEVQATTDQHRIEVHVDGQALGFWDADRLHQVLTNLLTNAVKYSPDGGLIRVEIAVCDGRVTVCVRDCGVGLTPEEAQHVFERFFRVQSARRLEGSGLGLYICQSILAAHGGHIWVESAGPGQGCSFCFALPCAELHTAAAI